MTSLPLDPRPIETVLIDEIEDRLLNNNRMVYDLAGYQQACSDVRELIAKYRKGLSARRKAALDHFFSDQP
jgi:hypothetical protein